MDTINIIIMALALSFILCAITGPFVIPALIKLKFGQEIREIGPSWHKKKSGTPTMGGVIFIIAITVSTLLFAPYKESVFVLVTALLFGITGFVDDFIKIIKKRNLGLTEKQKLIMQIVSAVFFVLFGKFFGIIDYSIKIPFIPGYVDIWYFYIPVALFVLVGGTNSVNLTDGLDGLAASVTAVVGVFFTVAVLKMCSLGQNELFPVAVFSAALTGGCIGFLLFNAHPAKVFMGDTGSLFLGGAICAMALVIKNPLILIICGGVYVIETLSVIIQVTSFKLTGKRVFKMSPIHHHFEMCNWSEKKIVLTAILISLILCIISYIMLF